MVWGFTRDFKVGIVSYSYIVSVGRKDFKCFEF